jgi:predicted dienelactone hydrolase
MKSIKNILKGAGILFILLFVSAAAFAGYLLIAHDHIFVLPHPTGSYDVGRVEYDWIDGDRMDTLSDTPNTERELLVWIWYPVSDSAQAAPAPYLPPAWVKAYYDALGKGKITERDLSSIQTHSLEDAPVAGSQNSYPVIIMQPGLGLVPADYTVFAENLASHGYIVVGINPTYTSNLIVFPDGRVVWGSEKSALPYDADAAGIDAFVSRVGEVWTEDAIFVMDMLQDMNMDSASIFHDKLDLAHLGLFGHSLGGATAAKVCKIDPRCKAGADMDGALFSYQAEGTLQVPFMFMENGACENCMSLHQPYSTSNGIAYFLLIQGTKHYNFSDFPLRLLLPARIEYSRAGYIGPISAGRGLGIVNAYLVAFFDRYLRDIGADLLNGPASVFPEVQFETRSP